MHFFGRDVSTLSVDEINNLFRERCDSLNMSARFGLNVVERAITRVHRDILENIGSTGGSEYACILEAEIEQITNSNR